MIQRSGTPPKGRRERGRPGPAAGSHNGPKAAKPSAKPSGKSGFSARKAGTGKQGAGPRKDDGTGGSRFRQEGKRTTAPRSRASAPSGGKESRRSRFPDVHVSAARGRQDENRIAKVMARAGLCSRRDAEDLIAAGRVAINGGTISSPAINVTERDRITVDGEPLPRRERTRLFLYHKPPGLVSTNSDPEGRPTLFDALPKNLPRLLSVGRLDIGTEGLLLLTNDGGLARELELPETGWVRRYRVRAHGHIAQEDLDKLREGVTVDGIRYGPIEATLERDQGANVWISFAITEGKNREVRNVLGHLGLAVNRLIRVEYGPFGLGALPEGDIEEVETGNLRAQLGPQIIARAGCDFSGPAKPAAAPSRDERREHRHALREQLRDTRRAPRDHDSDDDDRRPRRDFDGEERRRPAGGGRGARVRERDEQTEKPEGRPRRGNVWRSEDAPLRRTYRGSRREDLRIEDEDRPDKRTSTTTDRKGRSVVIERFGTAKEKPEPAEQAPSRGRGPRRGPPRDRASGPRPSRPRLPEERADRADRPRKFGSRSEGRRDGGPERDSRSSRPPRTRSGAARDGERSAGPRKFGPRGAKHDGKPAGRGARPSGPRGAGPRSSGLRPPRKH